MRKKLLSLIAVTLVFTGFFLWSCSEKPQIIFLSGAGMKAPITEIATNFEKETRIQVQTHFEGSSILRDYILEFKAGDLFLPGDKKNLDALSEKGLVEESSFMAWHTVSILVAPQLEGRINGLDDLAEDGVRLAISNPRLASLGRIVMKNIIERHPRGPQILNNVVIYGSSSQDVLRLYREGGIDAIIEWDVMATTPGGKGLIVVPINDPYSIKDELHAGLLTTSKNPALARKFYNYLRTSGKEVFRKHGYNTDL